VGTTSRSRTQGAQPTARRARSSYALRPHIDQHVDDLRAIAGQVLDLVEVSERRDDATALLIAVVEGLTLAACMGRLTPEAATDLAIRYASGQQTSVV
jgi:hypothetical protein